MKQTHLLEFFCKLVQQLDAPQALYVKGVPPIRRQVGNFSALAIMAKQHGKIVYCPDEWGLAVHPARGTTPKGTSTSQMMSTQACVVDFVLVMKECVRVVSRAISDPCCWRRMQQLAKPSRTLPSTSKGLSEASPAGRPVAASLWPVRSLFCLFLWASEGDV